jgi:hypothetical protein
MNATHRNKKKLLLCRIRNNYSFFKFSLGGVSREKLFDMARRIAVVTEAYEMLTNFYEWDCIEEIDFYLRFRDPLTIIADAWEKRTSDMMEDFNGALSDVAYSDTIMSEYPLIDGVDVKLYDKIMSFAG